MNDINQGWIHLDKKDMRDILEGKADKSTKRWFNYHLSKEGHNCKLCQERLEEIKKPE